MFIDITTQVETDKYTYFNDIAVDQPLHQIFISFLLSKQTTHTKFLDRPTHQYISYFNKLVS